MKFKVGDQVQVKEGLIGGEMYEDIDGDDEFFSCSMVKFCGKKTTVTGDIGDRYSLLIDGGEFNWTDTMLEEVYELKLNDGRTLAFTDNLKHSPSVKDYEDLVSVLSSELKTIDEYKYLDIVHFISVLRPELVELLK